MNRITFDIIFKDVLNVWILSCLIAFGLPLKTVNDRLKANFVCCILFGFGDRNPNCGTVSSVTTLSCDWSLVATSKHLGAIQICGAGNHKVEWDLNAWCRVHEICLPIGRDSLSTNGQQNPNEQCIPHLSASRLTDWQCIPRQTDQITTNYRELSSNMRDIIHIQNMQFGSREKHIMSMNSPLWWFFPPCASFSCPVEIKQWHSSELECHEHKQHLSTDGSYADTGPKCIPVLFTVMCEIFVTHLILVQIYLCDTHFSPTKCDNWYSIFREYLSMKIFENSNDSCGQRHHVIWPNCVQVDCWWEIVLTANSF